MHVLKLPLKASKYEKTVLDQRFFKMFLVHNQLVRQSRRLLKKLAYDRDYQALKTEYCSYLKKDTLSEKDQTYMKQLSKKMAAVRKGYGLTEAGLQSYIKRFGRKFKNDLSSQQVQKEATRVYRGVEKVLFSDGKELHFKRLNDLKTISGKTNTNGVKYDKTTGSITWNGLVIRCRMPKNSAYAEASLAHNISYCEVSRQMFPNGWHYYVNIYLKGDAPRRLKTPASPENTAGIDIGTSTVAAVSDHFVMLEELAPKCREYNKKIARLQVRLDRSRRLSNPERFHADGRIKKGIRTKWICSHTYKKLSRQLQSLYRQKQAYTRQSHQRLISRLILHSINFIAEDMNFKALQRKTKKTERQETFTDIRQKDGTVKQVRKFRRKKRFGKSLNDRAPASFLEMLGYRASQYGGCLVKADTRSFKASQYDHVTDAFKKCTLRDRFKWIGEKNIQRDLYSAFLLKNAQPDLKKTDRAKCMYEFEGFVKMHHTLIEKMRADGITRKQCFGF